MLVTRMLEGWDPQFENLWTTPTRVLGYLFKIFWKSCSQFYSCNQKKQTKKQTKNKQKNPHIIDNDYGSKKFTLTSHFVQLMLTFDTSCSYQRNKDTKKNRIWNQHHTSLAHVPVLFVFFFTKLIKNNLKILTNVAVKLFVCHIFQPIKLNFFLDFSHKFCFMKSSFYGVNWHI